MLADRASKVLFILKIYIIIVMAAFAGTLHADVSAGVPEIDPGNVGTGLVLLVGGYFVLARWNRRK
jgi:hypothetical protein